jgi:Zn-dependent protease
MNLSFPLGKIPVHIHVSFFIMTFLLGAGMSTTDLRITMLWIVIVLVSVLLHELGHALMGIAFGLSPQIDLHGMGGTTSWTERGKQHLSAPKKIAISLAGPLVGIVIGKSIQILAESGRLTLSPMASVGIGMVVVVNLWWGLLNLLPILPLDGGNVMAQVFAIVTGGRGQRAAHILSIVVAVAGGGFALLTGSWWPAMLAGMLAYQNFRALVPEQRPPANPPTASSRW